MNVTWPWVTNSLLVVLTIAVATISTLLNDRLARIEEAQANLQESMGSLDRRQLNTENRVINAFTQINDSSERERQELARIQEQLNEMRQFLDRAFPRRIPGFDE